LRKDSQIRKEAIILFILVSFVTATAQQGTAPASLPSVPLPQELDRVLRDYEAAWGAKDPARLAKLFAADGYVLPGGSPPVKGRAAIETYYTGHGGPLFLRAFAFATEGKVGYILGGYTGTAGSPDEGKFTLTLRKEPGGRWLIMSDMDNGNRRRQ
jgi:ketosteroid isomerase-like protein